MTAITQYVFCEVLEMIALWFLYDFISIWVLCLSLMLILIFFSDDIYVLFGHSSTTLHTHIHTHT